MASRPSGCPIERLLIPHPSRRVLIGGLLAAGLAGCTGSAPPPDPALWRARRGEARLWLFGTIHALPRGTAWQTPALAHAVADSRALVLEVPEDEDAATLFAERAPAAGLPPVAERLPSTLRPGLERAAAVAAVPMATLDGLSSWGAALALGGAAAGAAGARRDLGCEAVLAARFRASGKPVLALEHVAGQLDTFAALPEREQRLLLARTVADAQAPDAYEQLVAAWRQGDLATLDRRLGSAALGMPALAETLVVARSRRFANRVTRLAGPALVAVGAGHMVGRAGLPTLLAEHGWRVARVA